MNLKFILPLLGAVTLAACNNIDEADRYEPVDINTINTGRGVLIEEFTGQFCTNCPSAHKVLDTMKQALGYRVIPVSLHAGELAIEEGSLGDAYPTFKNEQSQLYADRYDLSGGIPAAVIDRLPGAKPTMSDQWMSQVIERAILPPTVNIEVETAYDPASRRLSVTTTLMPEESIDGRLQLWLTESGMVSLQVDGAQYLYDYVHNHVFRAAINGIDGEEVSLSSTDKTLVTEYVLPEAYNADNVEVVAFFFNDEGVDNAVVRHIIAD